MSCAFLRFRVLTITGSEVSNHKIKPTMQCKANSGAFTWFPQCAPTNTGNWVILINTEMITMMASSNGNISALLAICAGNSAVIGEFPWQGQWRGALIFITFICAWINGWVNNREAGDLGRHRTHYGVNVMHNANKITVCIHASLLMKMREMPHCHCQNETFGSLI